MDQNAFYTAKDICIELLFSTPCRNRAFNSLVKSGAIEKQIIIIKQRKISVYRFKTTKIEVNKNENTKTKKTVRYAWHEIC
jgi:hypothetical protein